MASAPSIASLWRRRPVFASVALVVVAWFLAYPALDVWLRAAGVVPEFRFWDFGAYGSAIERLDEGGPLYEQAEDGGYFGTFLYPPGALLLFEPFIGFVEYPKNRMIWAALTAGLFVVGVQLVAGDQFPGIRWWHRVVLAWATLGFQPVLLGMKMGQTSSLMGALLCFSYVGIARQRRGGVGGGLLSGACMAVVGFLKLAYAPTGAHLLADRRRFVTAVATGLALVALSVATYGVELHLTYLEVLEWGLTSGDGGTRGPELGSAPYFKPLYWIPGDFALRVAGSLAVAALALRSEASDELLFALGVAAFPLLTPLAYVYYLVALVPAALVVLSVELRRDGVPLVPVVGVWLLSVQTLYTQGPVEWVESFGAAAGPVYPWLPLFQPGLWGCLLLAGLAFVRVAQATTLPSWARRAWSGVTSG